MPLLRRMYPMGSFILTFMALLLLQSTLLVPHSATLSYRDFKALLKAGKVVEISRGERTISGRQPRNATVTTVTPCTFYKLHRGDLEVAMAMQPAIRKALEEESHKRVALHYAG